MAEVGRKQKKTHVKVSGGIAGFLVLSGAIAVAILFSVFKNRSKRRQKSDTVNNPSIQPLKEVNSDKKEEDGEGLRSLLPNTLLSEENLESEEDGSTIYSTPIGSLVKENETDLGHKCKEKAQGFDDYGPVRDNFKESLPRADDHEVSGAGISYAFEDTGTLENGSPIIVGNKEDQSKLRPAQNIAVTEESVEKTEETTIPQVEETIVHDEEDDGDEKFEEEEEEEEEYEEEEKEEEEEDDDDEPKEDENEVGVEEFSDEKEGESSDGTGDSSIESCAEAVWPTESFEVQGLKIWGDVPAKAVKEDAETGLEGEFAVSTERKYEENGEFAARTERKYEENEEFAMSTERKYEENGSFKCIEATNFKVEKKNAVCALIPLTEKAVFKSSTSRLLFIFLIVGIALHLLRSATPYYLQDSSPNVV